MEITDRSTLKSWFQKGLKPLASQFAAWIDSFWHKKELIPIKSVEGLTDALDNIQGVIKDLGKNPDLDNLNSGIYKYRVSAAVDFSDYYLIQTDFYKSLPGPYPIGGSTEYRKTQYRFGYDGIFERSAIGESKATVMWGEWTIYPQTPEKITVKFQASNPITVIVDKDSFFVIPTYWQGESPMPSAWSGPGSNFYVNGQILPTDSNIILYPAYG